MTSAGRTLVALAVALGVLSGAVPLASGDAGPAATAEATQATGVNVQRTHPSTNLSTFDAVAAADGSIRMDRSEVAVPGDVLVVRLDSAGIGRAIAGGDGENATARFRSWLAREDTSLRFGPVNGTGPALDPTGPGVAVRSGFAYGENRTYLVVRTGEARFGEGGDPTRLAGRTYQFAARDGNATLTSDPVTFERPSVTLDGPEPVNGSVSLERPTADVLGESSLPPGTPLTVSLVSDGQFVSSETVPLWPAGPQLPDRFTTFDAGLDTATVPASARLVVAFANRGYPYEPTLTTVNATVEGEPVNGSVTLETARARGALFDDLTRAGAVEAARARGGLVRSTLPVRGEREPSAFVPGDLLVVRIESERLASLLRDRPEDTPTARFRGYLHDTEAGLTVLQTPDTTPAERQNKRLEVRDSRFRVVADGDTRWLLVDTGNASVVFGDGEGVDSEASLVDGDAFHVSFAFEGMKRVPPGARDRVAVARPTVRFDEALGKDQFYSRPGEANVSVESTLAPGQTVTVVLDGPDRQARRTVALRGTNLTRAVARFDLSNTFEGDTFDLSLYVGDPGETETRVDEASVDRSLVTVDVPTATIRIAERSPTTVRVTGELSRGGTLALESPEGTTRYDIDLLSPGQFDSTLTLPPSDFDGPVPVRVVAYRTLDGTASNSADTAYTGPDGQVSVTLTLEPNRTPERTHTPETPPPTDDGVPEPGTTVPVTGETGDDGAGFGPLAAGGAVLVLAVLARRR